jgi:hypothetical protein
LLPGGVAGGADVAGGAGGAGVASGADVAGGAGGADLGAGRPGQVADRHSRLVPDVIGRQTLNLRDGTGLVVLRLWRRPEERHRDAIGRALGRLGPGPRGAAVRPDHRRDNEQVEA